MADPDLPHDADHAHDHGGVFPAEPVPRRRVPAGQALVVVAIALLVASLLNADRLAYTARTQPFGWQRTWAMRVTDVLATTSDTLRLNRPRQFLAGLADNEDPPPPNPTADVEIVRPGSGGVTTTTRPPEFRVPTDDDPVRILVAGDSLMGFIGPALVNELDGYPVAVTEDWKVSTGLARPDVLNWPAQLQADMAQYDPEVVILGFGGNDMQDMDTENGRVALGTEAWKTEYQRRVAQVLNAVEAPHRTVYWIGLPVTTRDNIEQAAPIQAEAVRAEISARPWAHYVDTRPILSPDGTYTMYLVDPDGTEVKVREGDGVHPNLAGATRMVGPVVDAVIDERKLAVARAAAAATTTTSTSAPSTPSAGGD
jgi:hypothetical protein